MQKGDTGQDFSLLKNKGIDAQIDQQMHGYIAQQFRSKQLKKDPYKQYSKYFNKNIISMVIIIFIIGSISIEYVQQNYSNQDVGYDVEEDKQKLGVEDKNQGKIQMITNKEKISQQQKQYEKQDQMIAVSGQKVVMQKQMPKQNIDNTQNPNINKQDQQKPQQPSQNTLKPPKQDPQNNIISIQPINQAKNPTLSQNPQQADSSFCIIQFYKKKPQKKKISQSLNKIIYNKYKIVDGGEWPKEHGYFDYLKIVKNSCSGERFLMFVSEPVKDTMLQSVNRAIHLKPVQATLVYAMLKDRYQVIAFGRAEFENIQKMQKSEKEKQKLESRLWSDQNDVISYLLWKSSEQKMQSVQKQDIFDNSRSGSLLWIYKLNPIFSASYKWPV